MGAREGAGGGCYAFIKWGRNVCACCLATCMWCRIVGHRREWPHKKTKNSRMLCARQHTLAGLGGERTPAMTNDDRAPVLTLIGEHTRFNKHNKCTHRIKKIACVRAFGGSSSQVSYKCMTCTTAVLECALVSPSAVASRDLGATVKMRRTCLNNRERAILAARVCVRASHRMCVFVYMSLDVVSTPSLKLGIFEQTHTHACHSLWRVECCWMGYVNTIRDIACKPCVCTLHSDFAIIYRAHTHAHAHHAPILCTARILYCLRFANGGHARSPACLPAFIQASE